MHIEKSEDLRLRVAEGVEYRPWLQVRALGKVDDHLRPNRPVALMMALRQTEVLV